jgi:hypothetical protein
MEEEEEEGEGIGEEVDVAPTPGDLKISKDNEEVSGAGAGYGGSNEETIEAANEVPVEAVVAESERRVIEGEEVTKVSEAATEGEAATGGEAAVDVVEGAAVAAVAAEDGLLKRVSGLWRFFGRPGSRGSTGSG